MRRLGLLVIPVALVAVTALPASATHSWGSYHWPRPANPFDVALIDSMTPAWDTFLGPVAGDWTASSVLDTPVTAGDDGNGTRKKCAAPDGAVRVCNAAYGYNGWLGLAQIWISGSHIAKGVAKVNDSYFDHPSYNDPSAKRHVLCQEVGHTLGLGHQDGVSCMNDHAGLFDAAYVDPNQHDYDQLETIYTSHTDEVSSGGGGNGKGNGKGGGGNNKGGKSSVHVRQDGRYTVVTFILWA